MATVSADLHRAVNQFRKYFVTSSNTPTPSAGQCLRSLDSPDGLAAYDRPAGGVPRCSRCAHRIGVAAQRESPWPWVCAIP